MPRTPRSNRVPPANRRSQGRQYTGQRSPYKPTSQWRHEAHPWKALLTDLGKEFVKGLKKR